MSNTIPGDEVVLEVQKVTKVFPGTVALKDVSIKFLRGEIHGKVFAGGPIGFPDRCVGKGHGEDEVHRRHGISWNARGMHSAKPLGPRENKEERHRQGDESAGC